MKISTLQRVALYILFFSINFEIWDPLNTNGSFSISKLTGYFYFLTLIDRLPGFLKISFIKKYIWPLIIFFLLLCVMNFINVNATSSQFIDISIFQNIILLIILINHERRERGILEKGMLSFALGSALLAIFFKFGIGVAYDSGRVTLFGDNENTIAMKECISIIFLLIVVFKNNLLLNKWRFLFLFGIPIMLFLMAQTGSRTAFISFALMFFVGLFLFKTKHGYFKILIFIFGVVMAYFVWQFVSTSQILYSRLQLTEQKQDIGGRDRVWDNVIPFVKQNLIFGRGESGYTQYITTINGSFLSPHNVILEVLSYTGVIGLFFYLLFLYKVFHVSLKKYKADGSLIQLLLLIPVLGLLLSGQLLNIKISYVIFAFCIAGIFSVKRIANNLKRNQRLKRLRMEPT